jgi:Uma2 family endonuclease
MTPQKAPNPNANYTYLDYCTWDDDVRRELIFGEMYVMEAPSVYHQGVSGRIYRQLASFLDDKPQEVYYAPLDVRLFGEGDNDKTVVQPDICVYCDLSKLDGKGGNGAPDMIVEVLSPSTINHDTLKKFDAYLRAGVREYWIADPMNKILLTSILQDRQYITKTYTENEIAPVHVLEGCEINLAKVFSTHNPTP